MSRYWPQLWINLKSLKRSPWLFLEIFFFPVLGISSFGFFTLFSNISFLVKMFLLTGSIGWTIVEVSQHAIGRGFMVNVWDNILKQTFTAPITMRDFVIGQWFYGIISGITGFLISALVSYAFFNFNLFSLGLYIFPVVALGLLSGLILGVFSVAIVLLLGLKVDVIIWTIVQIVLFFSGVYYSVAVFPKPIQTFSHAFPVIYMFEGMRSVLLGTPNIQIFINGFVISLVWIVIVFSIINRVDMRAKKIGFYQKYG